MKQRNDLKKAFCRALVVTLSVILMVGPAFASSFPDIDDSAEYVEAVEYLNSVGLMVGDTSGNFNPDKPVSRAEMATIVCRLIGETENLSKTDEFPDVSLSHWGNAYIAKAAELGIVKGYTNGKFGPSDTVTYEQALAMIIRAMGLEEEAVAMGGYPDGYIEVACEYGYTDWVSAEKGDQLTRWQVALILYNVFE